MYNRSRRLTFSNNSCAWRVFSADNVSSPCVAYTDPKRAKPMANCGSSSTARWKNGRAASGLFACQPVSGPAVQGLQSDDIMRPQNRNRADQECLAARSLADFTSHILGQPLVLWAPHQLQLFIHFLVGEDIQ